MPSDKPWLAKMPPIPFAQGVFDVDTQSTAYARMPDENRRMGWVGVTQSGFQRWIGDRGRPDLDRPQGQRYAVNAWLDTQADHGGVPVMRLLRGKGTEADKLWLAEKLSEVFDA